MDNTILERLREAHEVQEDDMGEYMMGLQKERLRKLFANPGGPKQDKEAVPQPSLKRPETAAPPSPR